MTNEELFEDLKQFIDSKVSQATAGLATKEDLSLVKRELSDEIASTETRMTNHMDEMQDAIAETLTHATESLDAAVQDHDVRLRRLEKSAA